MAGTAAPSYIKHRDRGIVRTTATFTCDASGDATADVVGYGFGRLVGVIVPRESTYNVGTAIITISDGETGAALVTYDTDSVKFGNTTTGDDTGGTAEDLFTTGAAHGLTAGDELVIITKTGGTLPTVGSHYFVIADSLAATTFRLSATSGGASIDMGSDISAMEWSNLTVGFAPVFFRPTTNIVIAVGTALSAHANNPNVNRDIDIAGRVAVGVAQGGNLGTGTVVLIFDETGLYDSGSYPHDENAK